MGVQNMLHMYAYINKPFLQKEIFKYEKNEEI